MFIHLGGDVVVSKEEVIAILNTQLLKKAETNREFIESAESDGFISPISDRNNAKSLVITSKKIYLSPISSVTLKKRSEEMLVSENIGGEEPW